MKSKKEEAPEDKLKEAFNEIGHIINVLMETHDPKDPNADEPEHLKALRRSNKLASYEKSLRGVPKKTKTSKKTKEMGKPESLPPGSLDLAHSYVNSCKKIAYIINELGPKDFPTR